MCKKSLLFKCVIVSFFLSFYTEASKASERLILVEESESFAFDSINMCDEALLILADTLRFHPQFDEKYYWGDPEGYYPSTYMLPLTYNGKISPSDFKVKKKDPVKLPFNIKPGAGNEWLLEEIRLDSIRESALIYTMVHNPYLIKYDGLNLPDAPKKEKVADVNVKKLFHVDGPVISAGGLHMGVPKADKWVKRMASAIQFSQNYVSDNWYQGGESNLNILSLQEFNLKRFDETKKKEFELNMILKTGFYTTPSDTMRTFRVNDNLFQVNSKFGLKAYSHWYYTTALLFKTQVFNNYKANTNELMSQILSPAEVNLSLGMDYKYNNKKGNFKWSMLIAPLSYNLKYVANIKKIDETRFGIKEGKHTLNQVGSSFANQIDWKISQNVHWFSRVYVFSNYEHVQGDFENVFNFTINRYFSTRISLHLRYDDDTDSEDMFQFKELLSFGFNYVW